MSITIAVTFIDEKTQKPFAHSDFPLEMLPPAFDVGKNMQMGDNQYLIVKAVPAERENVIKGRKVEVWLKEDNPIPMTGNIYYSIPTICSELPGGIKLGEQTCPVMLHEDDWRQIEFVSLSLEKLIEGEFAMIRKVYRDMRDPSGAFKAVHPRKMILSPFEDSLAELSGFVKCLSAQTKVFDSVGIQFIEKYLVEGGFSVRTESGCVFYGQMAQGKLFTLSKSIHSRGLVSKSEVEAVSRWASENKLMLINWCSAMRLEPGTSEFQQYLFGN